MRNISQARFDTRLSKKQKELFEYAANVGGFRNLTEFIVFSAQKEANKIIKQHDSILASEKDKKIFFEALLDAEAPNAALKKAVQKHKKSIAS